MSLAEPAAPAAPPRSDALRAPRKIPHLSPLLAALAVGAFALTDEQFNEALEQLRSELAPTTFLESIFVAMLIDAAEMLRVASRERDKIRAGDVKWMRYRNSPERSFWRALKAFYDGRKPVKAAKAAESKAAEETPKPAEAARIEAEQPAPTPPALKPAPTEAQPEPAATTPAPGAAVSQVKAQPESKPRPAGESIFLGKSPEVIRNLIAATAPRTNSSYLDISILPTQGGPNRDGRKASRSRRA